MIEYVPTIGIEVHAQVNTVSKMFCSCSTAFGDKPNVHLCPICLGLPGSLPKVNQKAVILGIKAARALRCEIPDNAQFARKNYFYPDLPKGYQISMYQFPIGINGQLELLNERERLSEGIGIERVHLEEDTAKLFHEGVLGSLIDFNRAGVPLLEIVSKPAIRSAKEAVDYLKELRRLLRFLGVSTANMEEGSFRCEVNISMHPSNSEELGTKVEIKNLNSFKAVEKSIEYEIKRQTKILSSGGEIRQATLGWDDKNDVTIHQRFKEKAPEYRYFPEPDLPDLHLAGDLIDNAAFDLNNIPVRRVQGLIERFGVPPSVADLLVSGTGSPAHDPYFVPNFLEEAIARHGAQGTTAANLMIGPVFEYIKESGRTLNLTDLTPKKLAEITKMMTKNELSSTSGKRVVSLILERGGNVREIVLSMGLIQVSEDEELVTLVKEIMDENEHIVDTIRKGKTNAIGALVGEAMKKSKGKANPKRINEILQELILKKKNQGE